jgi:RNA polymerase sigma-70 factor, ECF subfamily
MSSLSSAAEAVVIGLAASGETSAFDELVRRKQSGVRSLMRYLSHDAALAEDLAQQVFVEMWKSLPRLESPRAFHGWLKRIAVNVWLQHARKKDIFSSRRTDPLDEFEEQGVHDAPHGRDIDLDRALSQLPAPARLCIVLAYHEGMSHAEIAQATGMPLGTVKSHISRGEARLKDILSVYGEES